MTSRRDSAPDPAWRPALSGEQTDRALAVIDRLTSPDRGRHAAAPHDASLASGSAGMAVCYATLASVTADDDAGRLATDYLDAAARMLAAEPLTTSLYSGFPGIAWAACLIDRLVGSAGQDPDTDRGAAIDEALAAALRRYPSWGPYDLIDGLAGLGAYALARWPRPAARTCLDRIIETLAGRACSDADGVYWWTAPGLMPGPRAQAYPDGGVDLGVAHGIAGVLPLLARAHRLGVQTAAVGPLLDGAVEWLLAHLVAAPYGRTTPGFVAPASEPLPARSAWCYGDPGVAAALLLAARDMNEPAWLDAGTELALSAARRPPDQAGVTDGGVCHGTAGLAHMFSRLHQLTGEPELAEAALFWLERTLWLCETWLCAAPPDGPGAGPSEPAAERLASRDAGLLEGPAGIALVLLAACRDAEPAWDQMLLVSTGDAGRPAGARAR
jgi:hypothetical protein